MVATPGRGAAAYRPAQDMAGDGVRRPADSVDSAVDPAGDRRVPP
jgi:hypothetical protein